MSAVTLTLRRIHTKKLRKALISVVSSLENGISIIDSFKILYSKKYIDSVAWTMLVSSYKAGTFERACHMISEYQRTKIAMNKSFVSSLAYPLGVVISSFLMIYFLITIIFPKILPLFSSLHMKLPFATRCIVFISHLLSSKFYILFFLSILGGVIYLCNFLSKTIYIEKYILLRPPFSLIVLPREYYRISNSLYSLLCSKVSLPEALTMCAYSSSYIQLRESLLRITSSIESGKKLSESIQEERYFENEWEHMCAVGEMTGSLPSVFNDLAVFYEKQFSERLILLARWSEPLSLFISAVIILIVALSVLQPMYSIIQYIQPK
jgi:type II secretory pathway component PulF